ncbi:MAG: hypothetical protein FWE07_06705 [Turicibacter sp.]|nr:hypothetical protein [Turicibacter sp.]
MKQAKTKMIKLLSAVFLLLTAFTQPMSSLANSQASNGFVQEGPWIPDMPLPEAGDFLIYRNRLVRHWCT